jgi:ribonucleotide reductase class II
MTFVQLGGCLTKDALRTFDQGLLFADEHMEEGSGECNLCAESLTVRNGIFVKRRIANKEFSLIRITLKNGRQITMTEDHCLSIDGVWTPATKLQIGQRLNIELGNYSRVEESHLVSEKVLDRYGKPIKDFQPPNQMSIELSYFIGCLFGCGFIDWTRPDYTITFYEKDSNILEQLLFIGKQTFGIKGEIRTTQKKHLVLYFVNKGLREWILLNNLYHKSFRKDLERIPQKIRTSSKNSLLAFIAGFVDTHGSMNNGTLCISSISEMFLRHIQQIGEAVGLSFRFTTSIRKEDSAQKTKKVFWLRLARKHSIPESIAILNKYSIKVGYEPLCVPSYCYFSHSFQISQIEKNVVDYTYDYSVEGKNNEDAWYWQGAIKSRASL